MFHHRYIALGRGRQSIGDKILMITVRPFLFAHMLQVSKCFSKSDFIHIFNDFIHVYIAPGQGQKTPWGQTLMSTESPYHFDHLLQESNKSL